MISAGATARRGIGNGGGLEDGLEGVGLRTRSFGCGLRYLFSTLPVGIDGGIDK